jgi:hypothetical protein
MKINIGVTNLTFAVLTVNGIIFRIQKENAHHILVHLPRREFI